MMADAASPRPGGWRALLRFRRVGREALILGAGQVLIAAGSIVSVRLLTGALPPREYGELALALTVSTLGLQVLLSPLAMAVLRFFSPAREADDVRGFLSAMWRLTAQAVAIIAAVAATALLILSVSTTARWTGLIAAAFLYSVLYGIAQMLEGVLNAARERMVATAHAVASTWSRLFLAIALIRLTASASSAVAMAGYAAASAIVLGSELAFFSRRIAGAASKAPSDPARWAQSMLRYGRPFAAWGIFTSAQLASDRWALGVYGSASDVGLYTVVYQLGYAPMIMFYTLLGQVLAPVLFARAGDGSDSARVADAVRLNNRVTVAMFGFTIAAALAGALAHPLIGRVLLAPRYRGVTHFIPWMILVGGIFATAQLASMFFMIGNRSRDLTLPKIVTAIAGIAMSFAGARWFGIAGVVAASLLFSLLYMVWIWMIAGQRRK